MGNYPHRPVQKDRLWFHAVSVGEVMASKPILQAFKQLRPNVEVVLTTTTSSGHETAQSALTGLYHELHYFPIDLPIFQLKALGVVQPKAAAIMETELWLNFLWASKRFGASTFILNARLSDKHFERCKKIKFYYSKLYTFVDRILCQSPLDQDRCIELGAVKAEVYGNCKFDQAVETSAVDAESTREALRLLTSRPTVVIGSTRSELEEALVASACGEVVRAIPGLQIVWAPRHVERVENIVQALQIHGIQAQQRSQGGSGPYLILDTYGELNMSYSVADVVVIGGGFDNLGGQNLIQPLAMGKPVLHGPNMENFRDATEAAVSCGASKVCTTAEELAHNLKQLLPPGNQQAAQMGAAAKELTHANLGASQRYAEALAESFPV